VTQAAVNRSSSTTSRPPRRTKTRRRIGRAILVVFLLVVAAGVAMAFAPTTRWVVGSGYLMTDQEVEVKPSVEGAIAGVAVRSGDLVEAGQVLIQLNDSVQRAAYDQAVAELDARRAQHQQVVSRQKLEIAQRREQVFQAEQSLSLARGNLERMEKGTGGFAPREIDDARLKFRLAESHLTELKLPREEVMEDQVAVLREQIMAAEKTVKLHEAEIEIRKIRAPMGGRIYFNRFEPGEVVKPDHVLGQVFDTAAWVVKIKLSERDMPHVKVGQKAWAALSAYSTMRYGYIDASVSRVLPIVSPMPTGDGIFYVEAAIQPPSDGIQLNPGLTATAYIDAGPCTWYQRLLGW
jgi:multidrug resistance efflux pump